MKTLVMSDTHLTPHFDEKKFQVISRLIQDHDRVILNGDFWEGYLGTFDDFYNSPWQKLFPLLKSKDTVYLYGNHDAKELSNPKKLRDFATRITDQFILQDTGKTFHIEHGHRFLPLNKEDQDLMSPVFRFGVHFWNTIERSLIFLSGTSYQRLIRKYNNTVKQKSQYLRKSADMIICGHTHAQELDLVNGFANSGVCKFGLVQYLTIENGRVNKYSLKY